MRIQIGVSHGLADHLKVDDCQVQIVNTVDEIFTLEYQEIDFLTFFKLIFHRLDFKEKSPRESNLDHKNCSDFYDKIE